MPLYQTQPFPTSPLQTWQAPTFLNGWSNYGNNFSLAGYWKDPLGMVNLRGVIAGGTLTQRCFNLPEGYRPPYRMVFVASTQDSTYGVIHGRCDIDPNGDVIAMFGGAFYFSLDGISFRAA